MLRIVRAGCNLGVDVVLNVWHDVKYWSYLAIGGDKLWIQQALPFPLEDHWVDGVRPRLQ